jgi:hypothetical protein
MSIELEQRHPAGQTEVVPAGYDPIASGSIEENQCIHCATAHPEHSVTGFSLNTEHFSE